MVCSISAGYLFASKNVSTTSPVNYRKKEEDKDKRTITQGDPRFYARMPGTVKATVTHRPPGRRDSPTARR